MNSKTTEPSAATESRTELPGYVDGSSVERVLKRIPVFQPLIGAEEFAAASGALEMGWLGMGSYVGEFESALANYIEAPDHHVIAVSTGHAALHLSLLLAGVGPGDEVITPSLNNIADFQAILATGAEPVFCDIDEDSMCIDLDKAEALLTAKTKAMIVMDYANRLCDHAHASALGEKYLLRIVHDAAHSFGSRYQGRMVGGFSDITMFSFDPVKTITCIDGGAIVVRTAQEAEILRETRLIGMTQPYEVMYKNQRAWSYDVRRLGFRYHLANLHAALGLSQLAKMAQITATRRAACRRYSERLGELPQLILPKTEFEEVTPFAYIVRVANGDRAGFRAFLADRGIDTGTHWLPGHWFSLFKGCRRGDLAVTDRVGKQVVTLPLHSLMPLDVVDSICDVITSYFSEAVHDKRCA